MYQIKIEDMDLKQIADSGQCFTWTQAGENRWVIQAFGRYLAAEQTDDLFTFSCDEDEFNEIWKAYFDLERDYGGLKRGVDQRDAYLCAAISHGGGIRVLKQDLWEVMVSFLISQNNNISRIRNSIRLLCREYGRELRKAGAGPEAGADAGGRPDRVEDAGGGETCFTFPTPDELARATVEEFGALGLGYRAKYMKALAERMRDGGLDQLRAELEKADDGEARELLMGHYGIGRKVADCICLFGLHRVDMFPIDTHIRKIIDCHYGEKGFPFERYAGSLGIIQQYLFYYDLRG